VFRWLVQNGSFALQTLTAVLTPMAVPGGLDQLTFALGLTLRRKPLRDRRRWHVGLCPELICDLRGDPNEVGETLAIFGTAGRGFDAFKQRPSLFGAEMHFLEASEQFEALQHGTLHLRRDETFGLRLGCLV
jgi:hypothetical protein